MLPPLLPLLLARWRLVAAVVLLAGAFGAGWAAHAYTTSRAAAIEQAERAELAAEAERQARQAQELAARRSQEVQDERERKMRSHAAAAAGARSELDRLRDALAAADAAAAAATAPGRLDGTAGCAARGFVVGACGDALEDMAKRLDQSGADLSALQGWVRASCPAATAPPAAAQ